MLNKHGHCRIVVNTNMADTPSASYCPAFRALASCIPLSHIPVMQSDFSLFRGAAAL